MRYPTKIDGLLVKAEANYGVDVGPTPAADGVRGVGRVWPGLNPSFAFDGRRDEEHTGTLLMAGPVQRTGRIVSFSFDVFIRGAGAVYSSSVTPEVDALLRACGYAATLDATVGLEKWTYGPADEDLESATIYGYTVGKLYKGLGCVGVVTWPLTAGNISRLHFEMQGLLPASPGEQPLPAITYDGVAPRVAKGMTVSVGAFNPNVESGEFSSGGQVQRLDDATATEAIEAFGISAFDPSWAIQVPVVGATDFDPNAISKSAAAQTITQQIGTTQYNQLKLDSVEAHLEQPTPVEVNGFGSWNLPFQLRDHSIVFD